MTMPAPSRPLLDPVALEEAGRAFRLWLDRLLGKAAAEQDTDIAWESGEPDDDVGPAH
jgi:hypothetical protein